MKTTTKILMLGAALFAGAVTSIDAGAQSAPRFEARPFIGAYVPTGDQADMLGAAPSFGAQASFAVTRRLSILGTGSWSPSAFDHVAIGNDGVDIFQYDLGAEFKQPI